MCVDVDLAISFLYQRSGAFKTHILLSFNNCLLFIVFFTDNNLFLLYIKKEQILHTSL